MYLILINMSIGCYGRHGLNTHCLGPVNLLKDAGVEAIVVSGMGARPMQGFSDAGITVYYADEISVTDVDSAVKRFTEGGLPVMHPTQACKGSGNCHH